MQWKGFTSVPLGQGIASDNHHAEAVSLGTTLRDDGSSRDDELSA